MTDDEALAAMALLLVADPGVADRQELNELLRTASRLRGVLDRFEMRCTRRSRELAEAGRSESPSSMLGRQGRRSCKASRTIEERSKLGEQMPGFEEALHGGDVSAEHLDALASASRGLAEEVAAAFHARESELLEAARHESVEAFARRCRNLAKRLTAGRATSDADELDRQRKASKLKRWTDRVSGMKLTLLELDPLRDAELHAGIDAHIARLRAGNDQGSMSWGELQAQAVVDAVSAGVDGIADDAGGVGSSGLDAVPASRRARRPERVERVPEVTVLVGLDVLVEGVGALGDSVTGVCETVDGQSLPVSTVRRLCCDAEVIPAVLDGHGEVTDLGRSRRTANRVQRRQLAAMHRGCAHPDCTVTFSACRIHHVRWWWRDLGPTDIDNLLPLCEQHHHLVHEGGWSLSLDAGRVVTWTRPDGTVWHTGPTIDRPPTARTG